MAKPKKDVSLLVPKSAKIFQVSNEISPTGEQTLRFTESDFLEDHNKFASDLAMGVFSRLIKGCDDEPFVSAVGGVFVQSLFERGHLFDIEDLPAFMSFIRDNFLNEADRDHLARVERVSDELVILNLALFRALLQNVSDGTKLKLQSNETLDATHYKFWTFFVTEFHRLPVSTVIIMSNVIAAIDAAKPKRKAA